MHARHLTHVGLLRELAWAGHTTPSVSQSKNGTCSLHFMALWYWMTNPIRAENVTDGQIKQNKYQKRLFPHLFDQKFSRISFRLFLVGWKWWSHHIRSGFVSADADRMPQRLWKKPNGLIFLLFFIERRVSRFFIGSRSMPTCRPG